MTHRVTACRPTVLGLPVDALSLAEAVARVSAQIDQQNTCQQARHSPDPLRRQRAQIGAPPAPTTQVGSLHLMDGESAADDAATAAPSDAATPRLWQIVTLQPEIVMRARRTPDLWAIIQRAPLVTADGMGIVWALRLRGVRAPERVTGVDLLAALAQRAATRGYRLFLLGGAPGIAEQAGVALQRRYPGLLVAGAWAGSPDPADDAEARRRIRAARPDLLCVAYGAPAQERWIARVGPALVADRQRGIVAIGVGGALDLLAGRIPRAPLWMQRVGFEWLYRLARQPWRWRRMVALPRFAALACAEAWQTRAERRR